MTTCANYSCLWNKTNSQIPIWLLSSQLTLLNKILLLLSPVWLTKYLILKLNIFGETFACIYCVARIKKQHNLTKCVVFC